MTIEMMAQIGIRFVSQLFLVNCFMKNQGLFLGCCMPKQKYKKVWFHVQTLYSYDGNGNGGHPKSLFNLAASWMGLGWGTKDLDGF